MTYHWVCNKSNTTGTTCVYQSTCLSDVQCKNLQYDHSLEGLTTETDNKLDSTIFQWSRNLILPDHMNSQWILEAVAGDSE
jgi:hypothetical protein